MIYGYASAMIGLVPLLWLAVLHARGRRRGAAWWWMAGAFGVSFVADAAALVWGHPVISQAYPLLQAGLFAAVLVPRAWTSGIVGVFALASAVSLATRRGEGLDVLLHVVGWGGVSGLAWSRLPDGTLRITLALGFLALAWAWCAFVAWPTFVAWGVLQGVRLAMACGFVYAAHTEGV